MGPDEFHEKYPGADEGGLRNNAYTNVMVAWLCATRASTSSTAARSAAPGPAQRLGLTDDELAHVGRHEPRMFVPFHDDGIISQFDGYDDLEELDWDALPRQRYGNIQRLDRILRPRATTPTATS